MRASVVVVVVVVGLTARGSAQPAPCNDGAACQARGKQLEASDPAAAFAAYDHGCSLHDAMSCVGAAYMVQNGKVGKADPARAQTYFVVACGKDFEEPLACAVAGLNLLRGVGGTGDHAKDVELGSYMLFKSCDRGSGFGCYNFGVVERDGLAGRADAKRAYLAFDRACRGGEAGGCREQGIALLAGTGVAKDPPSAVALFEKACASAPAECYELAVVYDKGTVVAADDKKARELYLKSCDAGEGAACYNAALMIAGGRGGPHDDAAAHARLAQACKGGVKRACN